MRRPFSFLAAALLPLVLFPSLAGGAYAQSGEGEVKAAFVYNFAKFVDWPAEALGAAGSPLQICSLGSAGDPFLASLPKLEGKQAHGRDIKVRQLAGRDSLKGCQMVVVGESENPRLPEILKSLAGQPALSVGAGERFTEAGGMIGLVTAGNKVQFEINLEAAQRANLRLAAQFVSLARNFRK